MKSQTMLHFVGAPPPHDNPVLDASETSRPDPVFAPAGGGSGGISSTVQPHDNSASLTLPPRQRAEAYPCTSSAPWPSPEPRHSRHTPDACQSSSTALPLITLQYGHPSRTYPSPPGASLVDAVSAATPLATSTSAATTAAGVLPAVSFPASAFDSP